MTQKGAVDHDSREWTSGASTCEKTANRALPISKIENFTTPCRALAWAHIFSLGNIIPTQVIKALQ
jgi:hypothetical protein